ncbi:hypothetical protein DN752_17755 [Echinicola strongylocentroti]|uniref:Uncharacterized protein n=1 Tax=Echinicola strongylocentroti TaxID=1795355 RepID=A0A2Z4IM88_9BACT|nr:hypothetical protein [Echinicola strongylocentroti]AWW31827.1 hypothetical protein DN752_17755 [Echinicola strongylocentroti]
MNLEVLNILTNWTKRTEMMLRIEKKRLKVDDTEKLDRSLDHQVSQKANDLLEAELEFLVRGRFVDMGAGRARKIESTETNAQLLKIKKRRPKKWYSRTFYGRINDLQGILGYTLMEAAINSVKEPLESRSRGNVGRPRL